jgi:hypothetical protein
MQAESVAYNPLPLTAASLLLGYDFDDLKDRITDAVITKYEKALHFEHEKEASSAAYENTIQMELERVERERQQQYKDRLLNSYRI